MVLSADEDKRCFGFVEGESGFDVMIAGENETAYTGPECPTRRRDAEGGCAVDPGGRAEGKALPSRLQTRM